MSVYRVRKPYHKNPISKHTRMVEVKQYIIWPFYEWEFIGCVRSMEEARQVVREHEESQEEDRSPKYIYTGQDDSY